VRAHDAAGGVTTVELGAGMTLAAPVASEARAEGSSVIAAVRAEDVLVARRAPEGLSARNLFEARVEELTRTGHDVTLRCRTAASGPEWIVRVTPAAVAALELTVGQTVFLAVKSHSIRLV
jgi:molybdate transport system ATP-binding protein